MGAPPRWPAGKSPMGALLSPAISDSIASNSSNYLCNEFNYAQPEPSLDHPLPALWAAWHQG